MVRRKRDLSFYTVVYENEDPGSTLTTSESVDLSSVGYRRVAGRTARRTTGLPGSKGIGGDVKTAASSAASAASNAESPGPSDAEKSPVPHVDRASLIDLAEIIDVRKAGLANGSSGGLSGKFSAVIHSFVDVV